jgi:DNA-binding transcriptional MocR family regulator
MTRTLSASRLVPLLGSAAAGTPAYRGVADALRLLIADGRIPVGTRLPSERDLTAGLGVSRTTITRAYAVLRDSGYLASRQGSGSVAVFPTGVSTGQRGGPLQPSADQLVGDTIDLTCASMSAPAGTMAAYESAMTILPRYLSGTGYHPLGLLELREALASRYAERGLATTPDQIMVTSGALAGLAVAARAVLAPGDRVLAESPTYPNAIDTLRRSGARPVALPLGRDGWDDEAAEAALRQTAPRAAYLIPDFQNPTGALMSENQRHALGAALAGTHTIGIVDETLAELAHAPELVMPRPLAVHYARTITLGGASKTFWGGLRIGWIRAPHDLMAALVSARLTLDLGAPVLEQLVLLELLGRREQVLAERRPAIVAARDALAAAVRERLPEWSFTLPRGGLSLWTELPEALSTPVCAAADRRGLVLAPGAQFAVEGGLERFLRLPFTGHSPEVLVQAVDRLALAWADARAGVPGRPGTTPLVA